MHFPLVTWKLIQQTMKQDSLLQQRGVAPQKTRQTFRRIFSAVPACNQQQTKPLEIT